MDSAVGIPLQRVEFNRAFLFVVNVRSAECNHIKAPAVNQFKNFVFVIIVTANVLVTVLKGWFQAVE